MTCGPGTRTDTRHISIRERHGGLCLGEANIISECHDQTCPGTKCLVYDQKNKLRYII